MKSLFELFEDSFLHKGKKIKVGTFFGRKGHLGAEWLVVDIFEPNEEDNIFRYRHLQTGLEHLDSEISQSWQSWEDPERLKSENLL